MSLFKAREWWSAVLGEGEEFDQGCLCVGDVDNSGSGYDKVVVGSYMGLLRIFAPHATRPVEKSGLEAQLLEVQLRDPIIQVEVGKFVSCSELLHLAVLHPRKLSIYTVSGTAGNVEHGDQYQLRLVYEHNLQRTACNMTYGPFGGVTGHHFICIQSMDGMLMFFEQESYAFGRFLPGFLLPGPLCYCARVDAFITVSSSRQVECYRYETLAVATDADTRQNSEQQSKSTGKRLTAEWTLVLGEQALDIYVPAVSPSASSIYILGERNLFCLRDNGQIRFMKKLEYNPSCFLPYASVSEGTNNVLLANHNNMLLVYQDTTLKWAAQLAYVPVAVRIANFPTRTLLYTRIVALDAMDIKAESEAFDREQRVIKQCSSPTLLSSTLASGQFTSSSSLTAESTTHRNCSKMSHIWWPIQTDKEWPQLQISHLKPP
ncbi:protein PTHB1 isoform X1 [Tachysurus ichikawai]